MNTGKLLNKVEGHSRDISSVAITSDNSKFVSGSVDATFKVWGLDTAKCYSRYRFEVPIHSVTLSKHGVGLGDSIGNLYAGTLYT